MSAKVTVHIDYLVTCPRGTEQFGTIQAARGYVRRLFGAAKVMARKRRPSDVSLRRWARIRFKAWEHVGNGEPVAPTIIKRETRETVVS